MIACFSVAFENLCVALYKYYSDDFIFVADNMESPFW